MTTISSRAWPRWIWRTNIADICTALLIIVTFVLPVKSGLRPVHVAGALLLVVTLPMMWRRNIGRNALFAFVLVNTVILTSTLSAFVNGPGLHFGETLARNIVLFFPIFAAGYAISAERLRASLSLTPYLCIGLVLFILVRPDPFSYGGRLSFGEYMFAPSLSYVLVLGLTVVLAVENKRWFHYGMIAFLLLANALTFTRAEMISIAILFWIRIGFMRGIAIAAAAIAPFAIFFSSSENLQRLLVIQDILATGGSGRSDVWGLLITELIATPSALLFGFGPGHVHYIVNATADVDKAHSIPLDTLYSYGIFGFSLLVAFVIILSKRITWIGGNSIQILARDIVIVTFVNSMVNGSFFDGSLNGLTIVFFAFVLAVIRESPAPPPAYLNAQSLAQ